MGVVGRRPAWLYGWQYCQSVQRRPDGLEADDRIRDRLERLCCFAGEILVRCPSCDQQASVVPDPNSAVDKSHSWLRRRLICRGCGRTEVWEAPLIHASAMGGTLSAGRILPDFSGPNDPYFGLPLWLSAACCGEVLWAYNAEHLDRLEEYVSARLRERGPVPGSMSMLERLPKWIKEAKHRDEVVRTIRRLRTSRGAR